MHCQQRNFRGSALTCGAQRDTAALQQAAAAIVVVGLRAAIGIARIGLVIRLVDIVRRRGKGGRLGGHCRGSIAMNWPSL